MDQGQAPQATTSVPPVLVAPPQTTEGTEPRPESVPVHVPDTGDSDGGQVSRETRPHSSSTEQRLLSAVPEGRPTRENPPPDLDRALPPPPPTRSREGLTRTSSNRLGFVGHRNGSTLDWIVPVNEKNHTRRTVGDRLGPTIENAMKEREKYARQALWTGYALNIAIGLQVFLGALTTGLAAALPTGKQAQVSTSILGGLSTLVASYLARARGSGEPELSLMRVKDLDQFLRECKAFELDHAHEYGTPDLIARLYDFRRRLEELLGNAAGDRKTLPVGGTAGTTQAAPPTQTPLQAPPQNPPQSLPVQPSQRV